MELAIQTENVFKRFTDAFKFIFKLIPLNKSMDFFENLKFFKLKVDIFIQD